MLMTAPSFISGSSVDEALPRLLVVDDEEINRELFRRIFHTEYHLTMAATGEEALHDLATDSFDGVLLDVMLPGMSGFDVLREVREQPGYVDLPIIMISARSQEADIVHALRIGANDYIPKPFSIEVARARVRTHIDLKRLNDKRKRMIAELEIVRDMQQAFYRIVSHDLKGPLTNMRLAHSILRDLFHDRADAQDILDHVDLTVQDMQEMIRTFLDIAALQNGRLEMQRECVSVSETLAGMAERVKYVAEKKEIALHHDLTSGCVNADPRLLAQVLHNLLNNALKFTPLGGAVRLTALVDAGWVRFEVEDSGPGVAPHDQPGLFEMFGRSTPGTGDVELGHGLGLWIARQLVETMGGTIGYAPADVGGSIFWFTLPACSPDCLP
ncbi:MAG: response regulator [bacterium]|nr:response regulator [bacterium]